MMTNPTPGAPVPPDELLIRTYQAAYQPAWERGEFHGAHVDGLRAIYAQAMQEREALAEFLYALAWFIGGSPLEGALDMEASTRNWAERLRGGGSDG